MKKYTNYYWLMMFLALATMFSGYVLVTHLHYGAAAIMFTIGFTFWFAGTMAPDSEKYK